jgi:hypothetical protein
MASNEALRSTAPANSAIVHAFADHAGVDGVLSSVKPGVAVMCSPPATIGTPGKRRRAI